MDAPHLVLGDTEFSYEPIWATRNNFVFCYLCEPFWTLPDGRCLREEGFPDRLADARRLTAFDIEALLDGVAVADDIIEHERMVRLMIPVHFWTLMTTDGAARYAGQVQSAATELRQEVFLEIVGLPMDAEPICITGIVETLRPVCLGVCVRTGFEFRRFDALAGADIFAVGGSLRNSARSESDIIADLNAFALKAKEASLRSYAHGVPTTSLSVAAVCSGLDFVGSEVVRESLDGWAMDDYLIRPVDMYRGGTRKSKR